MESDHCLSFYFILASFQRKSVSVDFVSRFTWMTKEL